MIDERLEKIYFHAGRLFHVKGYAGTKMADIARAAGVAVGTMYNLFENKRAVLTFIIYASFEKDYLESDLALPIQEIGMDKLKAVTDKFYDRVFKNILHIQSADGVLTKSFQGLVSELFDMNVESLLATGNIESNPKALGELSEKFRTAKQEFFLVLEECLGAYIDAGQIRPLEYRRVHVQSIVDILTWWAMNAYVAMPEISIPRERAKAIAVDLVVRAYQA